MFTKEKINDILKPLLPKTYVGCELHASKFFRCWVLFIRGSHFTKPGTKWGIFLRKNKSGKYYLSDGGLISKYILQNNNPAIFMPTANAELHKNFGLNKSFTTNGKMIDFRINKIIGLARGVAAFFGLLTFFGVLAEEQTKHGGEAK